MITVPVIAAFILGLGIGGLLVGLVVRATYEHHLMGFKSRLGKVREELDSILDVLRKQEVSA